MTTSPCHRSSLLSLAVPLLLGASVAGAGGATGWVSVGPATGATSVVRVDPLNPEVLWAVGEDGVYRSADAGATWLRAWAPTADLPELPVSVELDPYQPDVAWVQVGALTLLRTADGGTTWAVVDPGVEPHLLTSYPDTMPFVPLVVGPKQEVVRSRNDGETWQRVCLEVDPSDPREQVELLAALPEATGVIYATTDNGLYRTTDGGASWAHTSIGDFASLAVALDDPDVVYATRGSNANRLLRSDSAGELWEFVGAGLPRAAVGAVVVDLAEPDRVWVATADGLHRSEDRGASWRRLGPFDANDWLRSLALDPTNPEVVVVGGRLEPPGVHRSETEGRQWQAGAVGLHLGHCTGMAADPHDPERLYACGAGLYLSRDRGVSWQLLSRQAHGPVAVDPHAAGVLYAGAWTEAEAAKGFVKTTDGGATWADGLVASAGVADDVWALTVDPSRAGTVYAGARNHLYRSTDSGGTWARLEAGPYFSRPARVVTDPWNPGVVMVPLEGVHRSTDYGATWTLTRDGLMVDDPCFGVTPCLVHDLAVDPFRPDLVYAASECGLMRSEDAGLTWALADDGLPPVDCGAPPLDCTGCDGPMAVAASPHDHGHVALLGADGVYQSTDSGGSWRRLSVAGLGEVEGLWSQDDVGLVYGPGGRGLLLNPTGDGLLGLWFDAPRRPDGRRRP